MCWDCARRTTGNPEAREANNVNGKGDEIGEYEMDQVILDLGSNTNFLPK